MTNATKAMVVAEVNGALALVAAWGVDLSNGKTAAVTLFVNTTLALWVGLTRKNSRKRIPGS